jgi:soluble lytic murein transglycosylase-like protein
MKAICVTFTIRPYRWARNLILATAVLGMLTVPRTMSLASDRVPPVPTVASLYRMHHIEIINEELSEKATDLDSNEAREVAKTIVDEAMMANYDPLFVLAIIDAESNFRVEAVSKSGARGLMQVLPSTFRAVSGARRMLDPVENVRAGIRYLGKLNSFKRIDSVLLAYNQGPGTANNVVTYGHDMPDEAMVYVPRVTAKYKLLLERNGRSAKLAHKSFRVSPNAYAAILQGPAGKSKPSTLPDSSTLASTP